MKTFIDFEALKASELYLHTILSRATGLETGGHEIDIAATNLMPQYKLRVTEWATRHAPAPVAVPTPTEPQISMKQIETDNNADIQRRVDQARAVQRLDEYAKNAGLANTQANANLIREWVEASGGLWTVQIVDAAIQDLNQKLEWHDPAAPTTASAPEAEKPEVLQPWQLKIDTPDWQLKTASVEALKDLVARRRLIKTGKYIRPRGTFGSSIF